MSTITPLSRTKISIALLVCESLIPLIGTEHGDQPKIFEDMMRKSFPKYQLSLDALDDVDYLTMDSYDVVHKMEYPSEEQIDGYDAVMYSGSAANAYADNVEWIRKLIAFTVHLARDHPRVKIFGFCFGHQIISLALGGTCVYNNGNWEIGPTKICLTDVGKSVFGVENELTIEQFHGDHVPFVPQGFYLLATTDLAMNQGMVSTVGTKYNFTTTPNPFSHTPSNDSPAFILPTNYETDHDPNSSSFPSPDQIHILTMQGHPEFTWSIVSKLIDYSRAKLDIITDDFKADIDKRNEELGDRISRDNELVGRIFWNIIGVS